MSASVEIRAIPEQNYEGRQWGYEIVVRGEPILRLTLGGTGPCWNFGDPQDEDGSTPVHVCDLDDLILALQALRDSDVYRENEDRWK